MSSETRFESNEESPTSGQPNERKNKRYVKKKGEKTRKKSYIENSYQPHLACVSSPAVSGAQESTEMNNISKIMANVRIKTENESGEGLFKTKEKLPEDEIGGLQLEKKIDVPDVAVEKNRDTGSKEDSKTKNENNKSRKNRTGQVSSANAMKKNGEQASTASKESKSDFTKSFKTAPKTTEERKRDRQTAQFAKAVARFSIKFMKAAKDLGITRPEEDSSSWSDSSSTCSDSSCSSSCTCSGCCTTDTSSCSCSDCNSIECSTCSWSSSSSSTLNSSTSSSSSSSTSSASSERISSERGIGVVKDSE